MKVVTLLVLFVCVAAAQPPWRDEPENPLADSLDAAAAGQKIFTNSCGACHGATGEGGRGPNLRDGKVVRRQSDHTLFLSIRKGVPGTDMPASNLPDEQIWQMVTYVRSLSAPASESKAPGDPHAGAEVFHGKGGCTGCHAIGGRGGKSGPDLTNIGATRSLAHLRESILKPNERLAAGYLPATATFPDGRSVRGVVRNHSNYRIQFQDLDGNLHLLDTASLKDFRIEMKSPMPDDFARRLTRDELTHLLVFLSRQAVRPEFRRTRERRAAR